MIKAVIYKDKNGDIRGFSLEGHAGFSKKGKDIVCSAVSVLVINTLNSINAFTDESIIVETDEDRGIIKCGLTACGSVGRDASLLIKSMILGLESVREQYGKYLEIIEECL